MEGSQRLGLNLMRSTLLTGSKKVYGKKKMVRALMNVNQYYCQAFLKLSAPLPIVLISHQFELVRET